MVKKIIYCISIISSFFGLLFVLGIFEPAIAAWAEERISRPPGQDSLNSLRLFGVVLFSLPVWVFLYDRFVLPRQAIIQETISRGIKCLDDWMETHLGRWIDFSATENKIPWNAINRWDVLFLAIASIYTALYTLESIQFNLPLIFLGSDGANIASMAAAHDHPEFFGKDYFLSDPANFRIYFQLHVWLVRWLAPMLGNYGLPFVAILPPTLLLTFLSNYWLGRTLFGSRVWAMILVVYNLIPIYLLFENWGLMGNPIPRTLIQALLPFLLGCIWLWRDYPKRWPLVAFLTGLLAYIHAVGTPTIMAVVTLGLFSQMPGNWSLARKTGISLGLGLLMILAASGFIINYAGARSHGEAVDYGQMISLYRTYFPQDILNVPVVAQKLFEFFNTLWILPLGVSGLGMLWLLRKNQRRDVSLLVAWLAGVLIVSVFIPYTERGIESYLRILPVETELIRGSRFFVPFLGLAAIWGLAVLAKRLKVKTGQWLALLVALGLLLNVYSHRRGEIFVFENTTRCLTQGKILCTEESDYQTLITALNEKTPINSGIFFAQFPTDTIPLTVRYLALRPLVFSWKDRAVGFSKPAKMVLWHEKYTEFSQYDLTTDWFAQDPRGFLEYTRRLGADYVVLNLQLNEDDLAGLGARVIYQNSTFTVLELLQEN